MLVYFSVLKVWLLIIISVDNKQSFREDILQNRIFSLLDYKVWEKKNHCYEYLVSKTANHFWHSSHHGRCAIIKCLSLVYFSITFTMEKARGPCRAMAVRGTVKTNYTLCCHHWQLCFWGERTWEVCA